MVFIIHTMLPGKRRLIREVRLTIGQAVFSPVRSNKNKKQTSISHGMHCWLVLAKTTLFEATAAAELPARSLSHFLTITLTTATHLSLFTRAAPANLPAAATLQLIIFLQFID